MLKTAVFQGADREAENIINAMGAGSARADLVRTTVKRLKSAALWHTIDCLQVYAGETSKAATVDWKRPGTPCALVGSVVFLADRHLAANGSSSYINTNFSPATGSVAASQDNFSMSLWARSNTQGAVACGHLNASTVGIHFSPRAFTPGDTLVGRLGDTSQDAFATGVTDGSGLTTVYRRSATQRGAFKNGATIGAEVALGSSPFNDLNFYVGALNNNGTAANFSNRQNCLFAFGAYRDAAGEAAFYDIFRTYLTALGAV